ncbi:MAG TPA: ATP-binding cassette domain-containing protein [Actinomycetota bacterium]|nr:ATP-binding cassette domain-containing protein [Actinomycetota bacterium]
MIDVTALTYSYPGATSPALDEVSLSLPQGELHVVSGASGGGKSTLLRCLNGLIPHFHGGTYSGMVQVDGRSTIDTKPRDLADVIGFMGQNPEDHAVVDRVEDDIAFGLENLGVDRSTMRKRVEEALDALGIASLRDRRIDTLSGGERQRAAIAAVMAMMPRYLVMDEPTSQLDPQSAEEVIGAILRLRDEAGLGVVVAEHRLERFLQYAETLTVVDRGRIATGSPGTVLEKSSGGPPIVVLGRAMGWRPLPLGLRDARRLVNSRQRPTRPLPSVAPAPPPGGPMISLDSLTVTVAGRPVVRDVDLAVAEGETVALMGRNGSGKSTLLRALTGAYKHHRGRIVGTRSIGYLPQDPASVLFRRSVAEELGSALSTRDPRTIEEAARLFGIEEHLASYPRDLSGGQRTRVAIASTACMWPRLLLLDEPTRGLDDEGKRYLQWLTETWRDRGGAVVLATHDVELAALVATRVILLSEGQVIVDGTPTQVLADSLTFSTQMNKIFEDPNVLTITDALAAMRQ